MNQSPEFIRAAYRAAVFATLRKFMFAELLGTGGHEKREVIAPEVTTRLAAVPESVIQEILWELGVLERKERDEVAQWVVVRIDEPAQRQERPRKGKAGKCA
jgi:hypothetical protein